MEGFGCIVVLLAIPAGLIALLVFSSSESAKRRAAEKAARAEYEAAQAAARRAYEEALRALASDPANAQVRTRALALGRNYSNYTRNQSGVTLFDEVALMNDINAACAAVSVQRPHVVPTPQPTASVEDRLTRLHDLKTRGLISEGEYDERRREILRDT
jgi:type II secretory pathway pseudopilin PulG